MYKGICRGQVVAVKVPLQQDALTEEQLKEFRDEVAIMRRIFHPNVVLFLGISIIYNLFVSLIQIGRCLHATAQYHDRYSIHAARLARRLAQNKRQTVFTSKTVNCIRRRARSCLAAQHQSHRTQRFGSCQISYLLSFISFPALETGKSVA